MIVRAGTNTPGPLLFNEAGQENPVKIHGRGRLFLGKVFPNIDRIRIKYPTLTTDPWSKNVITKEILYKLKYQWVKHRLLLKSCGNAKYP